MNAEPKKISVQRDSDEELWTVQGKLDDGFEWRLPILAKPHRTNTEPSERLYYVHGSNYSWSPRQYDELSALLDRYDCVPNFAAGWWFTQSALEHFAVKAPGITPEFYIRWPGYEVPSFEKDSDTLDLPDEPGLSKDELKFLKHLQRMAGTQSWEAMKYLWLSFRKQAVLWLAKERRPLDLGFIRIVPMPYRINWKEALAVRFGNLLYCFRTFGREKRQQALQESGFFEALSSVKLLAVDKDRTFCHWSIETLPSAELEQALDEHEYHKFQRTGAAAYARHMLRSMATRMNDTLRIFAKYAQAVSRPPGRRMEGERGFGAEIIGPELRAGGVRPGKGIVTQLDLAPVPFERLTDVEETTVVKPEPIKVPDFLKNVRPFKELADKIDISGL